MVDVVEALIRHRRGLAEIEAKLDAFEIKGRDVDGRLDRVERLLQGVELADGGRVITQGDRDRIRSGGWSEDEIHPPFQRIMDAARAVVKARDDHFDWDQLKDAIADLSFSIDEWDRGSASLDQRLLLMQANLPKK